MKVLIGDDHRLFRSGLRLQIQELQDGVEVLEAGTFSEVLDALAAAPGLDLVLLDLAMPDMPWRDAFPLIRERATEVPLVVISGSDDRRDIVEAMDLGAAGFIPKTSSGDVMISALRLVLAGGIYLPRELLATLGGRGSPRAQQGDEAERTDLTPRQLDVLRLMAEGNSNKEIAALLGLSDGTIKTHISAVLKALDATNRTKAIITATRLGILSSP